MPKAVAVFVLSGKGGTGKSLVAINVAQQLKAMGKKVGLIDADIANPNVPMFLKLDQHIEFQRETLKPVDFNGMKVYSMGLIAGDAGICMVGGQYAQILRDVVNFTEWGDIDYFVVDLPASQSDEFIELLQVFQNSYLGSIIVTVPAHEHDAHRVIKFHLDNEIPIIGLIENMSYFQHGKVKYKVFGESTVDKLAEQYKLPVLGKIPLSMEIREAVEKNFGLLPEKLNAPITTALAQIINAKPIKPGFLQKLKDKAKANIRIFLIRMVLAANQDVNIAAMQKQFGYEGKRIIRLRIMDDLMKKELETRDFVILDGLLNEVEDSQTRKDVDVHLRVEMSTRALVWTFLERPMPSGNPYNLEAAWYMGEVRVWGYGESVRGLYFMRSVWDAIKKNQNAMSKIKPLLEALA